LENKSDELLFYNFFLAGTFPRPFGLPGNLPFPRLVPLVFPCVWKGADKRLSFTHGSFANLGSLLKTRYFIREAAAVPAVPSATRFHVVCGGIPELLGPNISPSDCTVEK